MTTSDNTKKPSQTDYDVALRRLVYVAAAGGLIIAVYALWSGQGVRSFGGFIAIGLMTSGAAMLSGGLLGFLFGVPHTRETDSSRPSQTEPKGAAERAAKDSDSEAANYRPNTGLEQISDWLTKMLVGVGLIEIKAIPGKLKSVAAFVAKGLGGTDQAEAFSLTILVYFSVCGFVFGFLWARLYLKKWFVAADRARVEELGQQLSRLEERQNADARAFALVLQQLNRDPDDPPADDEEITEAIKSASTAVRTQIFNHVEEVSANQNADNYFSKNQAVISILKALIKSDTNRRYFRNYAELSYALRRKEPPDLKGAEDAITKAIDSRDQLGRSGWKYFEFRRARYQIEQDLDFKNSKPSTKQFVDSVLPDLRASSTEADRWERWCKEQPVVPKWMQLNNISATELH